MKLRVNPSTCDGVGFCAQMLPGLISLDEWGFPIVADKEIPQVQQAAARRAVKFCPRRAIELV